MRPIIDMTNEKIAEHGMEAIMEAASLRSPQEAEVLIDQMARCKEEPAVLRMFAIMFESVGIRVTDVQLMDIIDKSIPVLQEKAKERTQ